jgi:hypothetical protein
VHTVGYISYLICDVALMSEFKVKFWDVNVSV